MKVDYLHIKSRFKNLENVKVDFDEDNLMTVIVGGNGSGKSNVLEALSIIFINFDRKKCPDFSFEVKYRIGLKSENKWVTLAGNHEAKIFSKQYQLYISADKNQLGEPVSSITKHTNLKTKHSPLLPRFVFAYYSGPSDRLEKIYRDHRQDFYLDLLHNKESLHGSLRRFFYAKPVHSQFVLLAFFLTEASSKERRFLSETVGIQGLDSVHFVFKEPSWKKKGRFWGAKGVVREFIDRLYEHSLAPLLISRREDDEKRLTRSKKGKEFLHLFIQSTEKLRNVAEELEPDIFFKMLESTLLSDILKEVRVTVKVKDNDGTISFRELSEGEQQLLTVLGLLKFTGGEDTLFLLDEPDTHLNPAWTVKYLNFLNEFVPDNDTSHLLMVSHHPLVLAELSKQQVQVMRREANKVSAFEPIENPRGMGINFILRSDMFGLKSTIDQSTSKEIEKRNKLASKPTPLIDSEKKELIRLNNILEPLGFNWSSDDPDYMDFLIEKYHSSKETAE